MSGNLNYNTIQFVLLDSIKKEPEEPITPVTVQLSSFQDFSQNVCEANGDQKSTRSNDMDDFKLIEFVQQNPHLYDRSRKDHRDIQKRNNTWDEIGKHLGHFTGADCQKRFRNLRDRFAKYKRGQKNGNTGEPIPLIFTKMNFLSDHVVHRISSSNLTDTLEATAESSVESNILIADEIEIAPSTSNSSLSPPPTPPPARPITEEPLEQDSIPPLQGDLIGNEYKKKSLKRKREDLDSCLLDELKRANNELNQTPLSENELFGKMIGRTLDKLSDKKASEARLHIMHHLHEKLYSTFSLK